MTKYALFLAQSLFLHKKDTCIIVSAESVYISDKRYIILRYVLNYDVFLSVDTVHTGDKPCLSGYFYSYSR